MIKEKLRWVGVTSLFFGLVGGLIGTAFTFSLMLVRMPYLTEKGFLLPVAVFFSGYLFGVFVAGFVGATYALLRLATGAVSKCSWARRVCLSLVGPVSLLCLWMWSGYYFNVEPIRGPISYAIWNGKGPILFMLGCTLATMYLHSLAEKSYDFFSPRVIVE